MGEVDQTLTNAGHRAAIERCRTVLVALFGHDLSETVRRDPAMRPWITPVVSSKGKDPTAVRKLYAEWESKEASKVNDVRRCGRLVASSRKMASEYRRGAPGSSVANIAFWEGMADAYERQAEYLRSRTQGGGE